MVAMLVGLPVLVGLGDALLTGVGVAEIVGYSAVTATALFVASIILTAPSAFDLRTFRLGGVFVVAYEVTMLLGAPSVFAEHRDEPSSWLFLFTVCAAFALTTVAIAATSRPGTGRRTDRPHRRLTDFDVERITTVLSAAGLLVLALYLVVTPVIPLVEAIRGRGSTELAVARERALTQLGSPMISYLFGATRDVLLPAAAAMCLYQLLHRPSVLRFARFGIVGVGALAAAAATIEKSPVGRLVLVLFLTVWIGSARVLRWRAAAIVLILFVAFPFAVSRLSNSPLNSNATIATSLGERMFRVPANVHYHYIAYVNSDIDQFLVGRTLPNVGRFAPGRAVTITEEVQRRIFPDAAVEGNANGSYISNFYADFGLIGVGVGSILTGLLIGLLDRVNRSGLPPPLGSPLQAVTAVQLVFLTSSSVFDTIAQFPFGNLGLLAFIALFLWVWLPMRRRVVYSGLPNAPVNAST